MSVGLPTFNGAKTVERALESLARQTYPNLEVIICDDTSKDGTADICARYGTRYSNFTFVLNESNLGAHHNMMKTLEMSKGEFFIWGDQEDHWDPEFVSTLVAEFERDPEISAAMTATRVVYEDDSHLRDVRLGDVEYPYSCSYLGNAMSVVTKQGKSTSKLRTNLFIHGLMRREEFKTANEVYPGVPLSERQIICQMALSGKLAFIDRIMFFQTTHGTPIEHRRAASDARVAARAKPFRRARYMYGLAVSIVRNPYIPWYRKTYVPVLLTGYFWTYVLRRFLHRMASAACMALPEPVYARLKRQWRRWRPTA